MNRIEYNRIEEEVVDSILKLADKNENEYFVIQGCLLDSFILENVSRIRINKQKPKKYIIIKETYLNGWASCHDLILTNDINEYNGYYNRYLEQLEY